MEKDNTNFAVISSLPYQFYFFSLFLSTLFSTATPLVVKGWGHHSERKKNRR